jgi:crotonobetainyl-CoA:carnitine CoA-transferase CaiB-like acyl-CoA transferase
VGPIVSFSRSLTTAGADCGIGQHTEAVLREYGYSPARIQNLIDRGVVAVS